MRTIFDLIKTIAGEWEVVGYLEFTNAEILSVKRVIVNQAAECAEIHLLQGGKKIISLDKSLSMSPSPVTINDLSLYKVKVLSNGVDITYKLIHK